MKPIETPDIHHSNRTLRRLDRCVLKNKDAREAVRHLSRARQVNEKFESIPEELRPFAFQITIEGLPEHLKRCYADVLLQLSYDSSVDCMFPLKVVDRCLEIAELTLLNVATHSKIHALTNLLEYYNSEVAALIRSSKLHYGSPTEDVLNMIRYCCNLSKTVHAVDV